MFKETYGFDVDILRFGIPVIIKDSEPTERPRNGLISFDRKEDYNYYFENKSGTYLVKESSSTMLRLVDPNGRLVKLPIKHFVGENPRMKIELYS